MGRGAMVGSNGRMMAHLLVSIKKRNDNKRVCINDKGYSLFTLIIKHSIEEDWHGRLFLPALQWTWSSSLCVYTHRFPPEWDWTASSPDGENMGSRWKQQMLQSAPVQRKGHVIGSCDSSQARGIIHYTADFLCQKNFTSHFPLPLSHAVTSHNFTILSYTSESESALSRSSL